VSSVTGNDTDAGKLPDLEHVFEMVLVGLGHMSGMVVCRPGVSSRTWGGDPLAVPQRLPLHGLLRPLPPLAGSASGSEAESPAHCSQSAIYVFTIAILPFSMSDLGVHVAPIHMFTMELIRAFTIGRYAQGRFPSRLFLAPVGDAPGLFLDPVLVDRGIAVECPC
jgi:hypothetical protein